MGLNPSGPVRVSVVIPAYDEADYLPAALASLAQQDCPGGFEVIVVDNGSTDDTAAVAGQAGARVLHQPQRGVCAARQLGTVAARGEIVVSTDADTVHPPGWLHRLASRFDDDVVAVAGPCRYANPPWWAAVFPPLHFAAVAAGYAWTGRIGYVTATNLAFRRDQFPGYNTRLTQGGDEVDLLRRLRRRGHVVWDAGNGVLTSSRRMDQGLTYTVLVSYGYHYVLNLLVNRLAARPVLGPAPAIRRADAAMSLRRRRRWGAGFVAVVVAAVALSRSTAEQPRP